MLKPGGIAVSISGPPDPAFAKQVRLNPLFRLILGLVSSGIRKQAKRAGVQYAFLFMVGSGAQLARITDLIESGAIRPIIDRVFPFAQTNQALAYVEQGHARGKVVIKLN